MSGGSLIGKTKRNDRQGRVRGACLRRRGLARGSQAVCKVREEGKASSKKEIPTSQAAEESPTEGRRSPITRIRQRGLDHMLFELKSSCALSQTVEGNSPLSSIVGSFPQRRLWRPSGRRQPLPRDADSSLNNSVACAAVKPAGALEAVVVSASTRNSMTLLSADFRSARATQKSEPERAAEPAS